MTGGTIDDEELEDLTPDEQRQLGSIGAVLALRSGAKMLRWLAALVAFGAVVGNLLNAWSMVDEYEPAWKFRLGNQITSTATGLALAAIVLALSYLVAAAAEYLDDGQWRASADEDEEPVET